MAAQLHQVKMRVELRGDYVHAELQGRETPADMRAFVQAVKAACLEHGCPSILMSIRGSHAVYRPEEYGLDGSVQGYVNAMLSPACRVALLGDSSELHHAHDYIELVARQQKVNVRSFKDAQSALRWLRSNDDLRGAGGPGSDGLEPAGPSELA
jgi:hypothetical protein